MLQPQVSFGYGVCPMKTQEALSITHSLSNPSKMPCHGYSIPARRCITGGKLQKVKNSICSVCYALKGRYVFPNVLDAMEKRYQGLTHPQWAEAMIALIGSKKSSFFRWHDSGDLQGVWHLEKIVEIAKALPNVKFWLPTREYSFVTEYLTTKGKLPENLIVRLSALMLDGQAPDAIAKKHKLVVSGVSSDRSYTCPAPAQNNECKDCRACWNSEVYCVSYKKH
jgi:hypothetical protein